MSLSTGKQIRERWHNQIDPNVKKDKWSREEEALICRLWLSLGFHSKLEARARLPWREMLDHAHKYARRRGLSSATPRTPAAPPLPPTSRNTHTYTCFSESC